MYLNLKFNKNGYSYCNFSFPVVMSTATEEDIITLTLVVQPVEMRQGAQHCHPILVGLGSATGIFSQPEHFQMCQRLQM